MSFNRLFWENRTDLYFSKVYHTNLPIPKLDQIEREVLGDVKSNRILNLFCNFGLTSFALEYLGAQVDGVDFNPISIKKANTLREKLGLKANFICSDILEFTPGKKYDIIYASYGILHWIVDLDTFLQKIYDSLGTNGKFILVDHHSDIFEYTVSRFEYNQVNKIHFKCAQTVTYTKDLIVSPMGGNYTSLSENIYIDLYKYDTNEFVNKLKTFFDIDKFKTYDYFLFKRSKDDIQIGPNRFRDKNMKQGEFACYSLSAVKRK